MGRFMSGDKGVAVKVVVCGVAIVAALVVMVSAPAQAGLPSVEEPAIPVPAGAGDYCGEHPDAAECQGEQEPILGPGGCSSEAAWACYAHRMFLPEVRG